MVCNNGNKQNFDSQTVFSSTIRTHFRENTKKLFSFINLKLSRAEIRKFHGNSNTERVTRFQLNLK